MSAVNYPLIIAVNEMLRKRKEREEALYAKQHADVNRLLNQGRSEADQLKEKASAPEKILGTYANGQIKEKSEHGYHYEYYENGKTKSVENISGMRQEYDEEGVLRREFIPPSDEFVYDALKRLTKRSDSVGTEEYFYYGDSQSREHVVVKDETGKVTSYKHLTKEGVDNTEEYLHRLKRIKRLKKIVAKKYGRKEDEDGNVSYDMTKDTSKGSVLTFKDRVLTGIKETFER